MKIALSLSFAIVCSCLFAQTQKFEAPAAYVEAVKKLELHLSPDFYYKKGINIYKVAELKSAGFDIKEFEKHSGAYISYKHAAIFANVIFTGTIVSKEYDANEKSLFHSFYKVKVESTFKGTILPQSTVTICLRSGMIGDRAYVQNSNEPEVFVGEKVLLFLSFINFDMFEQSRKEGTFNEIINVDRKDVNSYFCIESKYTIHSNSILDHLDVKEAELNEAIETIKKLTSINTQNNN